MSGRFGWRPLGQACALAARDFAHEWRLSACLVLGLAAVLAPLLVLIGLWSGIVSTMTERLAQDPRNREIIILGNHAFAPDWLERLAKDPRTGFLVPRTRSLAATIDLKTLDGRGLAAVEMVPSAAGDPLLAGLEPPRGMQSILLSQAAARRLGVAAGDTVSALVSRRREGRFESARMDIVVGGLVSESLFGREAAFVALGLLAATEDYRDGIGAALADGSDRPRSFAGLRLFARDLDGVSALAGMLRAEGLEVRTRAAEIDTVRQIDHVVGLLVSVIAVVGAGGYALSLAANLWGNVERKRRDLALLRLIGHPRRSIIVFPVVQAMLAAVLGLAVSFAAYGGAASLFNAILAGSVALDAVICRLDWHHFTAAAAVTIALAAASSTVGGFHASRIDPAESLRDL